MKTHILKIRGPLAAAAVVAICLCTALPVSARGTEPKDEEPAAQFGDLPLVIVRGQAAERDIMAVFLTGDGGWGVTDKGVCRDLADAGIPCVAVNSFKYFWTRRTPEGAAADLERILKYYRGAWDKKKVVLIGYSLGADVLPFMLNRLSDEVRAAVGMIVLMGPSKLVEFEVHWADWLGRPPGKNALQVVPEIRKIDGRIDILCVYGDDDPDQVCTRLDKDRAWTVVVGSGHKFKKNYQPVSEAIIAHLKDK